MTQNNQVRNKLKDMKIEEVSFVDRGANQGAYVLLFKRENMDNPETKTDEFDKNEFANILAARDVRNDIWELTSVLGDAISKILESSSENKNADIADSIMTFSEELKKRINDSLLKKDDELAKAQQDIDELNKRYDLVTKLNSQEVEYFVGLADEEKAEIVKSEKPQEEIEKRLTADEVIEYAGEKISKMKVGETSFALIKKMAEEKQEAERKLQEEVEKRQENENIQKAKVLLSDYALEDNEALSIYKVYSKLSDEDKVCLEKVFQAGSAALKGLTVQKSLPTSEPKELTEVDKLNAVINAKYNKGKE